MEKKSYKRIRTSIITMLIFILASSNVFAATATTWNPVNKSVGATLSNGNLTVTGGLGGSVKATNYKTTGKWYWEVTNVLTPFNLPGVANELFNARTENFESKNQISYNGYNGNMYPLTSDPERNKYGEALKSGDILGIALDIDNKTIKFSKNGNWFGDRTLPTWNQYYPMVTFGSSSYGGTTTTNFGATPFKYQPPTGFYPYDGVPSTGLYLNKSITDLNIGQEETLIATVTPPEASSKYIEWVSQDPTIATVDATGKVTAIKEGQTRIVASHVDSNNIFTAGCIVNVTPAS